MHGQARAWWRRCRNEPVGYSQSARHRDHWDRCCASLSIDVTLAALAQRAGELLLLHAAGLAAPDGGGVVVLVGPSGRGKTTAARVLGRHFRYVSDESIGIDTDGTVLPYRR